MAKSPLADFQQRAASIKANSSVILIIEIIGILATRGVVCVRLLWTLLQGYANLFQGSP
jgi:hypothetical protein